MKHVFVLALLCFTASAYGQSPTSKPDVVQAPKKEPAAAITDKAHADIRDLQLAIANVVQQAQQAVAPYNNRIQQLQGEINALLAQAFKETGADPTKFQLDPNTLALVAKPNPEAKQPAKVPTKEPPKKP